MGVRVGAPGACTYRPSGGPTFVFRIRNLSSEAGVADPPIHRLRLLQTHLHELIVMKVVNPPSRRCSN